MKMIAMGFGLLAAMAVNTHAFADSFCEYGDPTKRVTFTDDGYIWQEPNLLWTCTWLAGHKMKKANCVGSGGYQGQEIVAEVDFEISGDTLWYSHENLHVADMTRCPN